MYGAWRCESIAECVPPCSDVEYMLPGTKFSPDAGTASRAGLAFAKRAGERRVDDKDERRRKDARKTDDIIISCPVFFSIFNFFNYYYSPFSTCFPLRCSVSRCG